jgi:hypothetical protein
MAGTIKLIDFFRHYKGEPHQMAAVEELQSLMPKSLLQPDTPWVVTYRAAPKAKEPLLQQGAVKLTPGATFSTKVTPHVTYGELTLSDERRRFTSQGQCDIATELCVFLEKVRAQFGGKPVVITSGHRPPAVNAAVGGASDSEHLYKPGCGAVDFWVKGADIYAVQDWCDKNWPYSVGYGAKKGFVHLGIRARRPRVRWDY